MADIKLSTVAGSGSGAPKLAVDLTYPADRQASSVQFEQISGIDVSSGLASVLSGTGKFLILLLETQATTAESNTAKLTIDGVVIFNDSFTASTLANRFIGSSGSDAIAESYLVESSFDFEYQTTADASISLNHLVRPIL